MSDVLCMTPARRLFYVPDLPNNREGPQAREPSKCPNGGAMEKDWPKRLLIASYKRLEKRL